MKRLIVGLQCGLISLVSFEAVVGVATIAAWVGYQAANYGESYTIAFPWFIARLMAGTVLPISFIFGFCAGIFGED